MKKSRQPVISAGGNLIMKVFFIAAVVLCIILAVATNVSLVSGISDFTDIHHLVIETNYDDDMLANLDETRENLNRADTVLIVKFTGERQSAHYSTLSTVRVESVLKGDADLINQDVNIYENNCISANSGKLYLRNFTVNNFMQKGKSYLVFVNKFKSYDKRYRQIKNITLDEYVMADYYDSLFCLEETGCEILSADSQNVVDYSSYQGSEYIVFSKKQKNALYEFKAEILDSYLK